MSVYYCAHIGYGFKIDPDKQYELQQRDENLWEAFQESDFAMNTDYYYDQDSDYFFGLELCSAEAGSAYEVPVKRQYNHDLFMQMMEEYKHFFPNEKSYVPHEFIMCSIS